MCCSASFNSVVERTNQSAQLDLIRGLLAVRWSWFVQQPVGRLAHAIGTEAASAGAAFRYLTDLITSGVQVLAFVLIAALLSWQFLVVLVVIALVATLALWPLTRRGRRTVRGDTRRLRRQAGLFVNTLSGVKAIRAMGRGQYFAAELESEIRDRGGASRPRLDGNAAVELREPAVGALLAIGFYLAVTRLHLPLQDLVIMAILTVRALGSVLPMQRQMQRFVRNRHKLAGLTELQADCAAQREPAFGAVPPRLTKALRFEGVRFGFPGRDILSDLCIEVPAGRITTLTGRSGIGKSTIVDLVVGLQQPAAGRVTIDGVDLAEIDIAAWRLLTGYVPQEILLVHDSLLRNVTLGAPGLEPRHRHGGPRGRRGCRFCRRIAAGAGEQRRGTRRHALGRAAATDRDRPGPAAATDFADSGRGDLRPGPRDRGRNLPQRARTLPPARAYRAGDLSPARMATDRRPRLSTRAWW